MDLGQKQKMFPRLVARLILQANNQGYALAFGECWRSPEQAAWNAAHGSGIKNSLHTLRLAIDLLLYKDGVWLQKSEDYTSLGQYWEAMSTPDFTCCWGGRFSKPDGGHFSLEHEGVK